LTTPVATPHTPGSPTEERCDRCGARAKVLATLHTGGELAFCRHHVRQHRAALEQLALIVEHPAA
jgi:ribosomal protein S14